MKSHKSRPSVIPEKADAFIRDLFRCLLLIPAFVGMTVIFTPLAYAGDTYDRVIKTSTLKCGYAPVPPAFSIDPNSGEFSGLDYDIITLVAKKLSLKIDWTEETGFGTSPLGLQSNKFDVFCTGNWSDARKSRQVFFSKPYYYNPVYVAVRKNDTRFDNGYNAINSPDITVAGIDNDPTLDIANQDFPLAKQLILPDIVSIAEAMETVVSKKADVFFISYSHSKNYFDQHSNKMKLLTELEPIRLYPVAFELPFDTRLKNMIDTSLTELIFSGQIDVLLKDYYGTDQRMYYPPIRPTLSKHAPLHKE